MMPDEEIKNTSERSAKRLKRYGSEIKKKIKIVSVAVIAAFVFIVFYHFIGKNITPSISAKDKTGISEEVLSEIINTERGFYSSNLPLVAARIEILDAKEKYVLYRVDYFPFGNIERSYSLDDTGRWIFNLERPLTGYKVVFYLPAIEGK